MVAKCTTDHPRRCLARIPTVVQTLQGKEAPALAAHDQAFAPTTGVEPGARIRTGKLVACTTAWLRPAVPGSAV